MLGIGYKMLPSQWEVFDRIVDNIAEGKRSQTVFAPNAWGKTSIGLLLAVWFKSAGKKVMYYSYDARDMERYAPDALRCEKKTFAGIVFTDKENIERYDQEAFDIIITDAATSGIDLHSSAMTEDEKSYLHELKRKALLCGEKGQTLSTGQQTAVALCCLGDIAENSGASVIQFENTGTRSVKYIPILSDCSSVTESVTTEEYERHMREAEKELSALFNAKVEEAKEKSLTPEKGAEYDATYAIITERFDAIEAKMEAGFQRTETGFQEMNGKLDRISESIAALTEALKRIEEATKSKKEMMEAFFSTNPDEESADSYISKFAAMVSKEACDSLKTFMDGRVFHSIRKSVELTLGSNALGKMSEESVRFLVSSKYLFNQNMNLEDEIDYSSICLLASKSFETELSKRFITGYRNYLTSKLAFRDWPNAVTKTVYRDRQETVLPLEIDDFMLGNVPFMLGVKGKRSDRQKNADWFQNYCKDSLMKGLSSYEVSERVREINGFVSYVKD